MFYHLVYSIVMLLYQYILKTNKEQYKNNEEWEEMNVTSSVRLRDSPKKFTILMQMRRIYGILLIRLLLDNITFYGFIGQTEQMVQP
jgi:hypothetical protein